MVDLTIQLEDLLTPNACCVLVKEIMKYVAYNSKQIPFSYEVLSHMIARRRRNFTVPSDSKEASIPVLTSKEKKAYCLLKQINNVFENFEFTFKSLEDELCSRSDIKQVMILIGPNLIVPKHVLRIHLPPLAVGHSNAHHLGRKNIAPVYRKLLECQELSDSLFRTNGPTNMFVLLGLSPDTNGFKSSFFLPVDYINVKNSVPQTIIILTNPEDSSCDCSLPDNKQSEPYTASNDESYVWFKTVKVLNGFRDCTIGGMSAVNIFRTLPSFENL